MIGQSSGYLQPTDGQATTSRTWGISGTRLIGLARANGKRRRLLYLQEASKRPSLPTWLQHQLRRRTDTSKGYLCSSCLPLPGLQEDTKPVNAIAKDGKTLEFPTSSLLLVSVQSFGHHLMNTTSIRAAHPLISPARAVICFLLDVPLSSYTPRLATLNESTYPDTDIDDSFAKLRPIVHYIYRLPPPDDLITAEAPSQSLAHSAIMDLSHTILHMAFCLAT
ncbi:hypothetical protein V8C44DRAFT_324794 [Trichoderma aethiopicum]